MPKILVVDDQRNMRTTLCMMLRGAGYDVEESGDGTEACDRVLAETFDLVLTDLKMGARDGIDVLRHVKHESPLTEVIVMTAYGTIESAVEAMRIGAYDYIQKPFTEEELLVKVLKAVEKRQLAGEMVAMAAEFRERYRFDNIIGRSAAVRDVLGRIVRIAPTDTTVLITGESGTGKELVARAIHANSMRAEKPFVPVNCAAITETLLESELFGHVRGAFTGAVGARKGLFEEANGGTFFFDEIAETPPSFQAKLLRAIQEGEIRRLGDSKPLHVDVRIIAATNVDLQEAIAEKRFRQDLFYRLAVARFVLPPLRERREDIPLLRRALPPEVLEEDAPHRAARRGRDGLPRALRVPGQHPRAREHGGAGRRAGHARPDRARRHRAAGGAPRLRAPELARRAPDAAGRGRSRREAGHRERAGRGGGQQGARRRDPRPERDHALAQDEAPQRPMTRRGRAVGTRA
ncbi:MAG: sigma-54 dependent transcriptional regulator [Sandaracinaceae bacterium]|nr:sigma-54 dependent transcriptional regulator [Sandaracinaceae bacterium]